MLNLAAFSADAEPEARSARWRSVLGTLLLVGVVLVSPTGVSEGQSGRLDGLPIREIRIEGLTTLPEDTLVHYLFGAEPEGGRTLDAGALDGRIRQLWDRELIDDIEVEAEPSDGGVRLIIHVVERPILVGVEYAGIKRVNRTDILEQMDRERIQAYEGGPLNLGELERLTWAIEELYKEKGYRFAEVTYTLETVSRGQARAIFTIDEGDKVKIGDIEFDGNTVFSDLRLRLAMRKTKESGLLSRITKKDIYNPATMEEDLDKVRDVYRKAGYKDILVGRPELDVFAKRPQATTVEQQKRRLGITIPIEEGRRWRMGEISVEGNQVFSDELLLRQFERPRGGWLRSKVVDDAVENISKLYSSVGYVFSQVGTELRERDAEVADIIVKVEEGDQFRIGRIDFDGNTKTQDKVLRRELLIQESTVMNMTAMQNSLLKIRQLNYFALDEEEPIEFDFDAEEKVVDLTVKGEEAERTELQFGGGYSELDGFFGQFAMRTTNFLGRGETFGVSLQTGRQRDLFDLEYRVPWFLDRPQTIGVRAFKQTLDSRVLAGVDFEQDYTGGSVTYGRNLRAFQSFSITYSYADVRDVRSLSLGEEDPLVQEFEFRSSSLRPYWVFNTLDSRYEPTRGLSLSASVEFAGSFLGGDSDFVRPEVRATWFKPLTRNPFKSSVGLNVEAGHIEVIDDGNLFPQQRYFLGGDSSVRGFRRRSIVVREEDGSIRRDASGFPIGGIQKLQANLEYHAILGGPFRLVFFGDAGGVFDDDQDFDVDLMRYSAGAELRITVPLFPAPLRFIYASNLDPLEDDQFESFDFSLSTSF